VTRTIVALVFVVCCCGPVAAHDAPVGINVNLNPDAWPIEPFTLLDHQGQRFTEARLDGQWTFVVFGDTRCAERCGQAMKALAHLRDRMGKAQAGDNTQVLFISVQPESDTHERLRELVTRYHPTFIAATGSQATLAQLSLLMNSPSSSEDVHHGDASIMLIGPDGFPRAQFLPPFDAGALTSEYLRMRLCRGHSR
jgi:protein SCO1/2